MLTSKLREFSWASLTHFIAYLIGVVDAFAILSSIVLIDLLLTAGLDNSPVSLKPHR